MQYGAGHEVALFKESKDIACMLSINDDVQSKSQWQPVSRGHHSCWPRLSCLPYRWAIWRSKCNLCIMHHARAMQESIRKTLPFTAVAESR